MRVVAVLVAAMVAAITAAAIPEAQNSLSAAPPAKATKSMVFFTASQYNCKANSTVINKCIRDAESGELNNCEVVWQSCFSTADKELIFSLGSLAPDADTNTLYFRLTTQDRQNNILKCEIKSIQFDGSNETTVMALNYPRGQPCNGRCIISGLTVSASGPRKSKTLFYTIGTSIFQCNVAYCQQPRLLYNNTDAMSISQALLHDDELFYQGAFPRGDIYQGWVGFIRSVNIKTKKMTTYGQHNATSFAIDWNTVNKPQGPLTYYIPQLGTYEPKQRLVASPLYGSSTTDLWYPPNYAGSTAQDPVFGDLLNHVQAVSQYAMYGMDIISVDPKTSLVQRIHTFNCTKTSTDSCNCNAWAFAFVNATAAHERTCCIYSDFEHPPIVNAFCIEGGQVCPSIAGFTTVGSYPVDTCQKCVITPPSNATSIIAA